MPPLSKYSVQMGILQPGLARSGRRGSALVFSLMAVVLVGGLAASFLQLSTGFSRRQAQSIEKKKAFYIAESGLMEAITGLEAGRTGNVGNETAPARFGEGLFWVVATDLGGGQKRLESNAMYGAATALLSVVVEEGSVDAASFGMFGAQSLVIQPGSVIDAYESSAGAYETEAVPRTGLVGSPEELPLGEAETVDASTRCFVPIGSNGMVTISGTVEAPTFIHGNVMAGVQQTAQITGEVTVTGAVESRPTGVNLPNVTVPVVSMEAPIVHSGATPLILIAGGDGYDCLRVEPGAEVIVQGPGQLVLGKLILESQSSLELDSTAGELELIVTDELRVSQNASMTSTTGKPTDVSVKVPGTTLTPVELFGDGPFHGFIYAPQADVEVASSFELFGSIVADDLTFLGPVSMHFDLSLAEQALDSTMASLVSWRIVELENIPGEIGGDPFVYLGVSEALCPLPSDSHEDQFLEVSYTPRGGGATTTYAGMESAFDWTNVEKVDDVKRDGEEVQTVIKIRTSEGMIPTGP